MFSQHARGTKKPELKLRLERGGPPTKLRGYRGGCLNFEYGRRARSVRGHLAYNGARIVAGQPCDDEPVKRSDHFIAERTLGQTENDESHDKADANGRRPIEIAFTASQSSDEYDQRDNEQQS